MTPLSNRHRLENTFMIIKLFNYFISDAIVKKRLIYTIYGMKNAVLVSKLACAPSAKPRVDGSLCVVIDQDLVMSSLLPPKNSQRL